MRVGLFAGQNKQTTSLFYWGKSGGFVLGVFYRGMLPAVTKSSATAPPRLASPAIVIGIVLRPVSWLTTIGRRHS